MGSGWGTPGSLVSSIATIFMNSTGHGAYDTLSLHLLMPVAPSHISKVRRCARVDSSRPTICVPPCVRNATPLPSRTDAIFFISARCDRAYSFDDTVMDGFCLLFFYYRNDPQIPCAPVPHPVLCSYSQLYCHHIIHPHCRTPSSFVCCRSHTLPLSRLFFSFSCLISTTPHIHRTLLFQVSLFPSYLSGFFHPRTLHCCSPIICFFTTSFLASPHPPHPILVLVSLHHHLICPLVPHLVCSCCSKGVDRRGRAGRERAPRRVVVGCGRRGEGRSLALSVRLVWGSWEYDEAGGGCFAVAVAFCG